jgi:hypothetical protein
MALKLTTQAASAFFGPTLPPPPLPSMSFRSPDVRYGKRTIGLPFHRVAAIPATGGYPGQSRSKCTVAQNTTFPSMASCTPQFLCSFTSAWSQPIEAAMLPHLSAESDVPFNFVTFLGVAMWDSMFLHLREYSTCTLSPIVHGEC